VINGSGTIAPFTQVLIGDVNFGQTETVTVTPSSATAGTLTPLPGVGTYSAGTGIYTVIGSAVVVTAALNGLVFTPTVTPDQSVTTDFSIFDVDTASQTARNATTSVTATFGPVPPTITVNTTGQATTDLTAITPFAGAVVADANIGQTETVTVTLSPMANGTLTNLGGGNNIGGVYAVIGSTGFVSSALAGLTFDPTAHQVMPGATVTTQFAISDTDTAQQKAIGATATVVATAGTVAPTILHTVAAQAVSDHGTIAPFAQIVIGDANFDQTETVTVTLAPTANGTLTSLGTGSYNAVTGVYTVSGSAASVSAALDGLVFVPTSSEVAPGGTVTTRFTISDVDTSLASVTDSTTTVIATAGTVLPTITGILANQTTTDEAAVTPFAHVTIADANFGQTETVTVTLFSGANGTLTPLPNAGTLSAGVYTVIGSARAVTTALNGLVFTPNAHQVAPGRSVITDFTIHDTDTASQTATDTTTSVVATAVAVPPVITGTRAGQAITDQGTIIPFSTVMIADANIGQTETVTVTLSSTANGTLSNLAGGVYNASTGVYTDVGAAGTVTTALDGLIFTPSIHQVAPGTTVATTFTIQDIDTAGQAGTDVTTTVVTTAVAVSPTITGTSAPRATTDQGTITPFGTVAITDVNFDQTETITVTLSSAANGTLTNLAGGTYNATTGVYTDIGTAVSVTTALEGVVFDPTPHQIAPGGTVTTAFTIHDIDAASQTATDNTTTVTATALAVSPAITGTASGQSTTDQRPIEPFGTVVVADANFGQTEALTVTLSQPANGTLTNLGPGGSYNAATGVYTNIGTASALTAALNGLVFTPTPHQIAPGGTVATTFTIRDRDTAQQSTTDSTTTVITTAGTVAPSITGTISGQQTTDQATIAPFAHVVIADLNFGQTETVAVTLSQPTNGTLTDLGTGSYNATTGVYTDIGAPAAVSATLNGLAFIPTPGEAAGGLTITTQFTIGATDTAAASATDATTSVTATAVTPPAGEVILSGASSQYTIADDNGSLYVQGSVTGVDGSHVMSDTTLMAFTNGIGLFDPTGTGEEVARLYLAALDRVPDLGGLQFWTSLINVSNTSLASVGNYFAASPEFMQDYGSLSNSDYVQQLYRNVLDRAADQGGLQYWTGLLASGASRGDVLVGFSQSFEFESDTVSTAGTPENAEAYRLYTAALDRAPDPGGLAFWSAQLANGATPTQVAQGFIDSPEFQSDYASMTTSDFVAALYENILHRTGDPGGEAFWTGVLEKGGSEASVIVGFSDSIENIAQTAGATHANWVFIPS
jgi:hypothetical protein